MVGKQTLQRASDVSTDSSVRTHARGNDPRSVVTMVESPAPAEPASGRCFDRMKHSGTAPGVRDLLLDPIPATLPADKLDAGLARGCNCGG